MSCPLCGGESDYYWQDKVREYQRCVACELVFVPSSFYLPPEKEKAHYDLHQNNPEDQGYRRFLSRLYEPMLDRLPPGAIGLDFGSGPGPTLSIMFEEAGFPMRIYDINYAPDASVLDLEYDFITATEVVEHLSRPGEVLEQLWSCLKPGGSLGLMTKQVVDREAFTKWHYKNDPTHVAFFSRQTFIRLAQSWQAEIVFIGTDVLLLKK